MLPRLNSGKLKPKMLTDAQMIGQQGINLIEGIVLSMGFIWNPTNLDVGIDGYVEIRDPKTGAASNCIIGVQSKATDDSFTAETSEGFEFLCDERDLHYWMNGNAPVILVRSRPKTGEAFWVSIKDYFRDASRRKSRKILFDKTRDRFDASCQKSLQELAVPAGSGIYLSALPKTEVVCTNLVPLLSFPEHIHIAATECRLPRDIWTVCDSGSAWLLKSGQLISFYDLRELPWTRVCDRGSVEEHYADEWAQSDDVDVQHDFVRLLNQTLKDMLRAKSIWFDKEDQYYFYAPTRDMLPRRVAYQSNLQKTQRVVFQGYPQKRDRSKMAYYRHSALEARFVRYDGIWYLQINPTYRYTSDGRLAHRNSAELLSKIKRLERSSAVQGQIVMWARLLTNTYGDGLFPGEDPLSFGDLVTLDLDAGIDDQAWLKREEDVSRIESADDESDGASNGDDGSADGQLALTI